MSYDSSVDTLLHIRRVNELLIRFAKDLMYRAICHDSSKLREPEKSLLDEFTPKLKGCTYGSDEYKKYLSSLGIALENHYKRNSHHPEHYENGVDGMDLLDLVEMFMDWKAAGERHADGNILKSINHNTNRFRLSPQLVSIFKNTVSNYGWGQDQPICIQTGKPCGFPCHSGCPLMLHSEQEDKRSVATKAQSRINTGKDKLLREMAFVMNPHRFSMLADWLDKIDEERGTVGREVQNDLRLFGKLFSKLLNSDKNDERSVATEADSNNAANNQTK